ncbi:MAG: helix-turn-helix transcriptional regulator [Lachnospiraceae bacterium]|nr:helix-turn-helix transcriptional regulator [Lachnospiraceae bacterium]
MNYREITKSDKQNITFQCTPFCIERNKLTSPDFMHIHNYHQLTVVTEGSATLVVNNFSYKVSAGSIYVISNFAPHYLEDTKHIEVINILFRLEDLLQCTPSLQQSEGFRSLFIFQASTSFYTRPNNILKLDYEGIQEVLRYTNAMLDELNNNEPGQDIIVQSYFLILITYLSRVFDLGEEPNQDAYAFYRLTDYLNQHYNENYTMNDLVKLSNLNERRLRNLFMQKYHCPPMQYINHIRLEKAKYYLITSDMNVSEIANSCGFDDSNYFSRKFKQEFGISPREFRRTL